jgi:hypothetical protein
MKERHIQDYLYTHPEVLFPTGDITEKTREYSIHGKRIDLLFVVDGVRYIVEIKNVPIQREHIGQVVEYYGLMRGYMKDANLSMVLVSPSIPEWRAAYLEELGIRCVEIPNVPTTEDEQNRIQKESRSHIMKAKQKSEIESVLGNGERVSFEDIAGPVTPKSKCFAWRMLNSTLEPVSKSFNEYEVEPLRITRSQSNDFDVEYDTTMKNGAIKFTRGGAWWGYRFGFSENMPKNNVPNISIIAYPTGLDVTIDAELLPSQEVMRSRIQKSTSQFDRLLAEHGRLWLKTYLKYEHQAIAYHWILADMKSPGEFDGAAILRLRREHKNAFEKDREGWIRTISAENKELTEALIHHLETKTKQLNLAMRLGESFQKSDAFWSLPFEKQVSEIVASVQRMKSLVDFFVR